MDPVTLLILAGAYLAARAATATPPPPGPAGAVTSDPSLTSAQIAKAQELGVSFAEVIPSGAPPDVISSIRPIVTSDKAGAPPAFGIDANGKKRFYVRTDVSQKQYDALAATLNAGNAADDAALRAGVDKAANTALPGLGTITDIGLQLAMADNGYTGAQLRQNQDNRARLAEIVTAPPTDTPDGANDTTWLKSYGQLDAKNLIKPGTREV